MERYLLYIALSLIFYLSASIASSGSHSHFFFTTVTTEDPSSDNPFYYTTRSIDEVTLYRYDSHSQVIERRVPWFRSVNGSLWNLSLNEYDFQISASNFLQSLRNHLNDTEEFHVLQILEGCVNYEDGTSDILYSYYYDGEPFMSFNLAKVNWTAQDPRAQYFADLKNQNQTVKKNLMNYLANTCLPHMAKLLTMGNCTLSRKEQPVVTVTQTPITNSTYRLNCRAYGHYPKNISMKWYKNGEPIPESLMERVTLPYPDITYLTWLMMNISQNNDDVYSCSIAHISLKSPLTANWRVSMGSTEISRGISNGGVIAVCLAVMLFLFLVVFGSVSFAKSRRQ